MRTGIRIADQVRSADGKAEDPAQTFGQLDVWHASGKRTSDCRNGGARRSIIGIDYAHCSRVRESTPRVNGTVK